MISRPDTRIWIRPVALLFSLLVLLPIPGQTDEPEPATTLAGLEEQVAELKAEYAARHAALQHEMEARIATLEAEVAAVRSGAVPAAPASLQ